MGKIFGISDLPVSIPTTPFEPVFVPNPPKVDISKHNPFLGPASDVAQLSKHHSQKSSMGVKNLVKHAIKFKK